MENEPTIKKALDILREAHTYWKQINHSEISFELWMCLSAGKERRHLGSIALQRGLLEPIDL